VSNKRIFIQDHAPQTSRYIPGFDSAVYSNLAIGHIQGQQRTIHALLSPLATDNDLWRVVNTKAKGERGTLFDAVAVMGAIDDDQAAEWVMNQHGRFFDSCEIGSVIETTANGLMRYLDSEKLNPHGNLPVYGKNLSELQDVTTAQRAMWDGIELKSHDGSTASLMLDLIKNDDHSLLFDAMKADDMPAFLESLDAEIMGYDAIIVENRKLDTLMQRLGTAMSKASSAGVSVTTVRQSEPFKRNKVTQVAAIFEMSDGQSVSIVFHNPDSTPSKLLPSDTLISWKILLNTRDISAAVQPNQGEDVQLPVLATRIMKLVNQNSARFKRTNAKKAENLQVLAETTSRIERHQVTIADLDAEMVVLQAELDKPVVEPSTDPDEITQAEADDWNAGDEMPHQGEYQEENGETIKYVITKPRRNAKGVLIVADKRKAGGRSRIDRLCEAKGINGRWSGVQNGWIISSEKKVEKLIDLLNAGWTASTVTGELIAPKNVDPAPQPTPAVEPEPLTTQQRTEQAFEGVKAVLAKDYGWSPRGGAPLKKAFDGAQASGGLNPSGTVYVSAYQEGVNLVGSVGNGMSDPKRIAFGHLPQYNLNQDSFDRVARLFNRDVENYIDARRRELQQKPAVEPTTITTDLGNNESVSRGMVNNGDGTFTAMTATQSKTFKTRAGAERWLAQRGLNPDGSALEKPLPREIDIVDLEKMGVVQITDQGSENIYFVKDGREHFAKVMNTEDYPVGEFDLGQYPQGLPRTSAVEPAPAPEEAPMPTANPDAEYLQSIVDGTADLSAAGDELERIGDNLPPELEALFEEAAEAYAQYAIGLEV
jgi:hypothetical protein